MGQFEREHPELFALEFGKKKKKKKKKKKNAEYDFVFNLSSTNMYQSAPNLIKMYVIIRFQMSSVMDLIGPELSELYALELENLP